MRHNRLKLFAAPYIVWIIAFTIIPLIIVAIYAFTDSSGAFTLENIKAIGISKYARSLGLSLLLSLITTLVCFLIAYPLALILKSMKIKNQNFVLFIFILPMWMNFLLRTYAWKTILIPNGLLDNFLELFGITGFNFSDSAAAILFGMAYDFLPFMIMPIYNTVIKIDDNLINASRDLGAGYFTTLRKIVLPLSVPGIVSGVIMVFVPSLTTFAVSKILGGSKYLLIGDVIENQFMTAYDWHLGAGISFVLMIFIIIYIVIQNLLDKDEGANLI